MRPYVAVLVLVATCASAEPNPHEPELERRCTSAGGRYVRRWWSVGRCAFGGEAVDEKTLRDRAACAAAGGTWYDAPVESWVPLPAVCDLGTRLADRCRAIGFHWTTDHNGVAECAAPTRMELDCIAAGGALRNVHLTWHTRPVCERPTRDRGKPCFDGSQCEGECVLPAPSLAVCHAVAIAGAGHMALGVCSPRTFAVMDGCTRDGHHVFGGDSYVIIERGKPRWCSPFW